MRYLSIILAFSLLIFIACPSDMPDWHGKLYSCSSRVQGIIRSQSNHIILASEPEFDDFVCLSYEDLSELIDILKRCKKWD